MLGAIIFQSLGQRIVLRRRMPFSGPPDPPGGRAGAGISVINQGCGSSSRHTATYPGRFPGDTLPGTSESSASSIFQSASPHGQFSRSAGKYQGDSENCGQKLPGRLPLAGVASMCYDMRNKRGNVMAQLTDDIQYLKRHRTGKGKIICSPGNPYCGRSFIPLSPDL